MAGTVGGGKSGRLERESEEFLKLSCWAVLYSAPLDWIKRGRGLLMAPSRSTLFCFHSSFCCRASTEECWLESSDIFGEGVDMLPSSSPLGNSMTSGGGKSGIGGGGTEGNSSSSSEESFLLGKLGDWPAPGFLFPSPEVVDVSEETSIGA